VVAAPLYHKNPRFKFASYKGVSWQQGVQVEVSTINNAIHFFI
jgi:hypothetical protein